MAEAGKVLFHLTDDALIVANSGAPFTREGVIAICYSCISPKSNNPPEDKEYTENGAACTDARLPILLRNEMLGLPANARKMFMGTETQTTEDYAGRFELELLQNADDAVGERANSELIGAKGKGFKSVFDITDKPQISSGDFHFLLEPSPGDGLRVPACSPAIKSHLFPDAVTVTRLGFRDDEAKKSATRDLAQLRLEMLLFCQRLSRVEIHIDGKSPRILEMDRNNSFGFDNGKTVFTLRENGVDQKWIRWSAAWDSESTSPGESCRRLSAALCLPANKDGEAVALENERPIHVFFPTSEELPGLMALMHASYRLGSNRKHLLEVEKQRDGSAIREKLRGLAADILREIPPSVSLRTFGEISRPDGESLKTEASLLRGVFSDVVADTRFVPVVGGGRVRPAEARLWRHNLGCVLRKDLAQIRAACFLDPSLDSDNEARNILGNRLGAKDIGGPLEHAEFLAHCENDDNEKCIAAFRVANSVMLSVRGQGDKVAESLKTAPFWRTDNPNRPARALTGDILLWRRPDDWPKWLEADALLPEFTDGINGEDFADLKQAMGANWPLDRRRYFKDALVRFCRGKPPEWWEKMGEDALEWALKWGKEIVGESGEGLEFGRIIHLPTNNGWLPAAQCYFGKAWGGRGCFNQLEEAGVVKAPNEWRTGNDPEWPQMLNWLGVSRTPRLYCRGSEYYFDPPALEALIRKAKPQELLTDICEMAKNVHGTNAAGALLQLQNAELIPCKPGIFHPNAKRVKPGHAYMPNCGIKGYFPEVGIRNLSETMREWLPRLGVLTGLPPSKDKSTWQGYMRNLAEESKRRGESSEDLQWKKGELAEVIRELYGKYGASLSDMGDVPYLRQARNGDLFVNFAPAAEVRWMDMRCHTASAVHRDILGEFKIFPLLLEEGRHFGLMPLSSNGMEWLDRVVKQCQPARLRWDEGKEGDVARFIRGLYSGQYGDAPIGMAFAPFLAQNEDGIFVHFARADEVRWADKPYYEDPKVRQALLKNERFKIFPWFLNRGENFQIKPLSAEIPETCSPGREDHSAAKKLRGRYAERERAFALRGGDNGKQVSRGNIRAFSSLQLVLQDDDGRKIVQSPIDAFLKGEEIYVNVNKSRPLWRAFAEGLAQWMDKPEYRADFECILSDERREDWIYRLRAWGISEEDLVPLEDLPPEGTGPDTETPEGESPHTPASSSVNAEDTTESAAQGPIESSEGTVPQLVDPPPAHVRAHKGHKRARANSATAPARPPKTIPPGVPPETKTDASRNSPPAARLSVEAKHKKLQDEIHLHPEKIGLPGAGAEPSYKFPSEDEVDLLFTITGSEYVAVEVKPEGCPDSEIKRGAYQCVKYDALLKAAIKLNGWPIPSGRTIFALGGKFPQKMKSTRKFLENMGVQIWESLSD